MGWNAYLQMFCFVAALASAAAMCVRRGLLTVPPASFWCFLLCGGFGLISSGRSYWPPLTLVKGGLFCGVILLVALLCSAVSAATVLRSLYLSIVLVFTVGLVLGFLLPEKFPLTVREEYTGRVRLALFAWSYGDFAYLTGPAFLIGRLPCVKGRWYLQALLLFFTIASGSKASTASLVLVWFMSELVRPKDGKRWAVVVTASIAAILTVQIALNTNSSFGDKMLNTATKLYGDNVQDETTTFNGRTELWEIVRNIYPNSLIPPLGFGFDGERQMLLSKMWWAGQSHNAFLEVFLATGVLGATAFLVGWVLAILGSVSAARAGGAAALSVHCFLLIASFAGPVITLFQSFGLFVILCLHYWVAEVKVQARIVPASVPDSVGHQTLTVPAEAVL